MKISVLTTGTRGDVQPFLAFGRRLVDAGHDVTLSGPSNFRAWSEDEVGVPFDPLPYDMAEFMKSELARRAMAGDVAAGRAVMRDVLRPLIRPTLDSIWATCRDSDVIVYHPEIRGVYDIAEVTGAHLVTACLAPATPTAEFPITMLSVNLGGFLNRRSYTLPRLSRFMYRTYLDAWRVETLGLTAPGPRLVPRTAPGGRPRHDLCAVSSSVVPRPRDWPAQAHMCGYWFLDSDTAWAPPDDLTAFLEAGDPPVYIGFGSMTGKNPAKVARAVVDGVRKAGVRAIVSTGWGAMADLDLPETIFETPGAPHDILFRHVAGVVHHGGAGTTAAGLRAGRPTMICPFGFDQFFWAKRVRQLGCGPRAVMMEKLTPETMAAALTDLVGNPDYRRNAEAVGARIRAEDGSARALEIIESLGR